MARFLAWTLLVFCADISLCSEIEHGFDGTQNGTVSTTGADEMTAAIEAAKVMVGVVKDVVNGLINEVNSAKKKISDMKSKAVDLAEVNLPEFTSKVADAIVEMSSNQVRAGALYSSMHSIIEIAVSDLTAKFSTSSEADQKTACLGAQAAMLATMETAVSTMTDILNKQLAVNKHLQEVHDLAALYETTVDDKMKDKRGWLTNKEKTLREEVYIPCCIANPLVCAAVCVPILEAKIHDMENDLSDALKTMQTIASDFDGIANKAGVLLKSGQDSYKTMSTIEPELETVVNMEKLTVTVPFWKLYILPKLKDLDVLLVKAMPHQVIV
jgi:hypothetical protein